MARNKLSDLNNHLFEQIETIMDRDLDGKELRQECHRARTLVRLSREVIHAHSLSLRANEIKWKMLPEGENPYYGLPDPNKATNQIDRA